MSSPACCRFLAVASLAALAACASAPSATRPSASLVGNGSAVLGEVEISRSGARTAYDVIRRLRPEYLAFTRRNSSSDEPAVYVDGIRVGSVEALRTISSNTIQEIRRIDARDATTRFGTGHTAGAILILTKSGR